MHRCHTVQSVCAWNRTGHEAIAYIAEQHLTPSAKAAIEKYLDGRSIVYYAAWMDQQHEHIPYKHTVAVDADNEPLPPSKRPELDAMNAIMKSIDRLENRSIHPKDTVALDIKFIVHLIADIHCPAHIVYPKITRFFPVNDNGRPQSHHRSGMRCSTTTSVDVREYQEQLDRFSENRENERRPEHRSAGFARMPNNAVSSTTGQKRAMSSEGPSSTRLIRWPRNKCYLLHTAWRNY